MSISSLLNIGSRAMAASYAQLTVTGNNIANANTPGYSRQTADLETSFSQQTGSGFFGSGVNVTTVQRSHNDFLTREAATSTSIAAADGARSTQLQQLENVFKTDEAGLGYAAQQAFNAFVDVANDPQDPSARQAALARLGDLAGDFSSASGQIDSQQAGVVDELRTSVASVNSLTSQIAALNKQIAAAKSSGHDPNSLLDQRDPTLNKLSQLVQVTTVSSADGTVGVYLGGSQTLVLGGNATALTTVPDAYDPSKLQLGITEGGRRARSPTASSAAARSAACCVSRTTTSPMRAACSASSRRRSPARSMRSRRSASTSASRPRPARRCSRSARRRCCLRRTTRWPAACRWPRTSTAAARASRASASPWSTARRCSRATTC